MTDLIDELGMLLIWPPRLLESPWNYISVFLKIILLPFWLYREANYYVYRKAYGKEDIEEV